MDEIEPAVDDVLRAYRAAFRAREERPESDEVDPLMAVFDVTPEQKRTNRQYWGRELGMCWQRIVVAVASRTRADFAPALTIGADEPCDLRLGALAIDTKYRIGSGDSGTLKKFRDDARRLVEHGYEPVMLILRTDNLSAAIASCRAGGWRVLTGAATFDFILAELGTDLEAVLRARRSRLPIG